MKNPIKTSFEVVRRDWTVYDHDHPEGSGYCLDQGTYQILYKTYRLFGKRIWRSEIDRETVPNHELISLACFGNSTWKSKFKDYIKS